ASRRTSSTVDVLAPRHPLQWDGGDGGHLMDDDHPAGDASLPPPVDPKKDAASKRLIRPKTTADYLARLPQFEPRPIPFADLQEYVYLKEYDVQVQREQLIDDVLSKFMAPYIRDATKRQPFLNDAKRAIAGYVGARETEYDRRKAKTLLTESLTSLETTRRKLQEIAGWPE